MGNLDDALQKFAKRHGIERQLEASDVVEKATAEIAGIISKDEFEVISFNKGVLKVGTASASARSEINLTLSGDFKSKYGIKRLVFAEKPQSLP